MRVGAVAMLEWASLRFVESAPIAVWIATTVVAVAVLAVLQTKDWLDFKGRWYFTISLAGLLSAWIAISAYGFWAYPPQDKVMSTFPTADELATAIAKALTKPEPPGGAPTTPTPAIPAPSNNAALDQMRIERDNLAKEQDVLRATIGPISPFLHLTDAKRWSLMTQLRDLLVNQIPQDQRCHAFLASKTPSSSGSAFWSEFQPILNYTNWILEGGANRSAFPDGITIQVAAEKGTAFTCGWKLSELLESMNVGPINFRANQTTPNLLRCPECTEIVIGDVTVH